ncbi:DDI1 [Sanghuangporus sanghuang]
MRLTFVNDMGQSFVIEIDPQMSLEDIMALLEAESGIPANEQSISWDGHDLNRPKATMAELGVGDDAVLVLRRKITVAGRSLEQDAEMMRLQILGDPELMRQLRESQPEIAEAAANNPQRFEELLRQTRQRQTEAELDQQREIERLNADPFDVEAQQKIEEAIRQQAVMENMAHALEFQPESFGRVTMLYIPVEVNGTAIKAFVDSGAQQTIMSPECAERCGIMRLLDRRFAGVARGVGTANILGRVHSAQLKLSDLYLPCAFTVMEGRDVDLLFGLDMLKAHQACIDLEKNVLRIRGREVRFLAEHELPAQARVFENPENLPPGMATSTAGPSPGPSSANPRQQHFPGSGQTLGPSPASARPTPGRTTSNHPESSIQTLMGLGATREDAIQALDAMGGNVDYAASMLFQF